MCRRFGVADFADHDHVGRLPQDAAEQFGEVQVDGRVDLRLADSGYRIFDRILDGVDLALAIVEVVDTRIKRRGLAAARRPRDQDQAAGIVKQLHQVIVVALDEAQPVNRQKLGVAQQQSQRAVLAMQSRQGVDAQVHCLAVGPLQHPTSVHRPAMLRNVQAGHRLDVGDAAFTHICVDLAERLPKAKVTAGNAAVMLLGTKEHVADTETTTVLEQAVDDVRHILGSDVDPKRYVHFLGGGQGRC